MPLESAVSVSFLKHVHTVANGVITSEPRAFATRGVPQFSPSFSPFVEIVIVIVLAIAVVVMDLL